MITNVLFKPKFVLGILFYLLFFQSATAQMVDGVFQYNANLEHDDIWEICPYDLIACECGNSYMENNITDNEPSSDLINATKKWMSKLNDTLLLSEISIPGTHDSGAKTPQSLIGLATQTWDINEQLQGGIRYFDIRAQENEAGTRWEIHHGGTSLDLTFDQVADWMTAFLEENEDEVIIMSLALDGKNKATIWEYYTSIYPFLLKHTDHNQGLATIAPELGSVRKNIYVLYDLEFGDLPTYNIDKQSYWKVYRPGPFQVDLDCVGSSEENNCDCVVTAIGCLDGRGATILGKERVVAEYIDKAANQDQEKWTMNELSGAQGITPACVAAQTNDIAFSHLNTKTSRTNVGTIIMDYPGEGLIYRIIKTNFDYMKRVDYSVRIDCGSRAYGESNNQITVKFYNGTEYLGADTHTAAYCNDILGAAFDSEFEMDAEIGMIVPARDQEFYVTHFTVEIAGTDDLFIDQVLLSEKRFAQWATTPNIGNDAIAPDVVVWEWGQDGGSGWCLSDNQGPYNCSWYDVFGTCRGFSNSTDCKNAWRFEVGLTGAFPTSSGGVMNTFMGNQISENLDLPLFEQVYTFNASPPPPPVAVCKDFTLELNEDGQAALFAANIDGGSYTPDNPDLILSYQISKNDFTCNEVGVNSITLTVENGGGTDSCSATVTVVDNIPPEVITQNITTYLDENGSANIATSQIDNGSYDACGIALLNLSPNVFDCGDIGENSVTLSVTDENNNSATNTAVITIVDNIPPEVITQNITVYLDENGGVSITPIQVDDGSNDACGIDLISVSPNVFDCGDIGENTVTLSVTDVNNNTATNTAIVTVLDNIPPVLTVIANPITLWPPNHKYQTIDVSELVVSVTDNCAILSADDVYITNVSSDELENGNGDGNTTDDIVIDSDCHSVDLRKERSGNGNGRVYTIYLKVDDGNGNYDTASSQVFIPHNKKDIVIDDGMVYEETCSITLSLNTIKDYKSNLVIYPNPTKSYFNLRLESNNSKDSVEIHMYDINGRQVYYSQGLANQEYRVNTRLQAGLYFVNVTQGNESQIVKLVKY